MFNVPRRVSIASVVIVFGTAPLLAQTDAASQPQLAGHAASTIDVGQVVGQPAGPPPTPPHTGIKAMIKDLGQDVIHLPSKENAFWAGVGGGLALAAHPADDNVTPSLVGSDFAGKFFKPGEVLGESPTLFTAATT